MTETRHTHHTLIDREGNEFYFIVSDAPDGIAICRVVRHKFMGERQIVMTHETTFNNEFIAQLPQPEVLRLFEDARLFQQQYGFTSYYDAADPHTNTTRIGVRMVFCAPVYEARMWKADARRLWAYLSRNSCPPKPSTANS